MQLLTISFFVRIVCRLCHLFTSDITRLLFLRSEKFDHKKRNVVESASRALKTLIGSDFGTYDSNIAEVEVDDYELKLMNNAKSAFRRYSNYGLNYVSTSVQAVPNLNLYGEQKNENSVNGGGDGGGAMMRYTHGTKKGSSMPPFTAGTTIKPPQVLSDNQRKLYFEETRVSDLSMAWIFLENPTSSPMHASLGRKFSDADIWIESEDLPNPWWSGGGYFMLGEGESIIHAGERAKSNTTATVNPKMYFFAHRVTTKMMTTAATPSFQPFPSRYRLRVVVQFRPRRRNCTRVQERDAWYQLHAAGLCIEMRPNRRTQRGNGSLLFVR